MGFLLARPTLYLQALLVLVAVTAGMPGMGSTDDSLVLLDDSDWSQGLLGQAESPAQAEAAAEEAEKEAEKEEGADPKPPQKDPIQKRPAHPADGAVVGNKEQIRAVILATAKKANMQMSPEEQRNFNTNEVDSNTGKIAKGELSNNHLLAAVLESKPVPAPSPPEKKKQAEAQKKALATGTEAKTTEQVYHDLLTKMSKSMPHNMAAVEHKS